MNLSDIEIFNKTLTKLTTVLNHDCYIIDNAIAIGGTLTEDDTTGTFLARIDHNYNSYLREKYKKNDLLYIPDIKKFKNDESLIEASFSPQRKEAVFERWKNIEDIFKNVKKWENFDFSPEEITTIFDDRKLITFTKNKFKCVIGKEMFPLLKNENVNDVVYSITDCDNTYILTLKYHFEMLDIEGIFQYLKI